MNILLIAYDYGVTASGVITKRVTEQLSEEGNNILVVADSVASGIRNTNSIQIIRVQNCFKKNNFLSRLFRKIESIKFAYIYDWLWVKSATKKIKEIFDQFNPNIIYCRTTPAEACYVGEIIHREYPIPLFLHFSDPFPAPLEYLPDSRKRRSVIKKIRNTLHSATIVSYGNEAMLSYVQKILGIDLGDKAFISPDMSSGEVIHFYPLTSVKKTILTYFGNIYGGRNPQPLYEAIELLNLDYNDIELHVYSKLDSEVVKHYPFVKSMDFDIDTFKVLSDANVLVDLDGDDKEPVFISSKLKDYLLINRPILSITPENSPSAALLNNMTTVEVVRNDVEEIKQSIMRLLNIKIEDSDYKERMDLIRYFGPRHVTSIIVEHMVAAQSGVFL